MPWEITTITDRGAREHYRFRVEGWNTEGDVPASFCWSVPGVGDARYVPHRDAGPETLRAIAAAKEATAVRPCLACAREDCAQAGYPGQDGHVCERYSLDGEEVDIDDLDDVMARLAREIADLRCVLREIRDSTSEESTRSLASSRLVG